MNLHLIVPVVLASFVMQIPLEAQACWRLRCRRQCCCEPTDNHHYKIVERAPEVHRCRIGETVIKNPMGIPVYWLYACAMCKKDGICTGPHSYSSFMYFTALGWNASATCTNPLIPCDHAGFCEKMSGGYSLRADGHQEEEHGKIKWTKKKHGEMVYNPFEDGLPLDCMIDGKIPEKLFYKVGMNKRYIHLYRIDDIQFALPASEAASMGATEVPFKRGIRGAKADIIEVKDSHGRPIESVAIREKP